MLSMWSGLPSPRTLPSSTTTNGRNRPCAAGGPFRTSPPTSPRPPASVPCAGFFSIIGAHFDFDLHNDRRLAELRGMTPAETLMRFRAVMGSSTSPLGPSEAWLGEVVVHSEDIRRPLGIVREAPLDVLGPVATFFARRNFTVNSRSMIEGLRVEASDGPVVAGDGPLVTGTTLALMMAMAGRGAYCDELTGPGVETLRARCAS